MWIVLIVVLAVVIAAAAALRWSSNRTPAEPIAPDPPAPTIAEPAPMTGLESALDQVTDRSGRKMREKIEAGTAIDDLRVPDDTGPILRRALDQVQHSHADHHPAASGAAQPIGPVAGGPPTDTTTNTTGDPARDPTSDATDDPAPPPS